MHFDGTLVITDPCYITKEVDTSGIPQFSDFMPKGLNVNRVDECPDYDGNWSEIWENIYRQYSKAYKEWDKLHPDDWCVCGFGENMNALGICKYICKSTIYGDWSCALFEKETNKIIGRYCADSGMVIITTLEQIMSYNQDFKNWAQEHDWCVAIVPEFNGEVETYPNKDNSSLIIECTGSHNLKGIQIGL